MVNQTEKTANQKITKKKILKTKIQSTEDYKSIVSNLEIGKTYAVSYVQNGVEEQGNFTVVQHPQFKVVVPEKKQRREVLERQRAWLK